MWQFLFYPLFAVAMAAMLSLIYAGQRRAEKKLRTDGDIRTYPPLALRALFLGCGIAFFAIGVVAGVMLYAKDASNSAQSVAVAVGCFMLFSLVGFFGYAYVRFNFVVTTGEGIIAHRLFRKTKFYRYEEIAEIKDTVARGIYGGLVGYGTNGKKIFAIEAVHIGAQAVANRLYEKGVKKRITGGFIK